MALVVGKDMATGSLARTFADIDLDDDKTPHLSEEVMSMKVEGFDDDFLCSVFDYLGFCSLADGEEVKYIVESSEGRPKIVKVISPNDNIVCGSSRFECSDDGGGGYRSRSDGFGGGGMRGSYGRGGSGDRCYKCGEMGHLTQDCR
ncbi:glycine-rich protein 2-like [Gossypium arboreum]|uniref:glycine-rich protein 2-like n=1 Tax=Gossypium arboreum TaxID=29729 RepID=UPI0008191D06|nr:glycine-rich protein 2-like [Gossypium arboreum]